MLSKQVVSMTGKKAKGCSVKPVVSCESDRLLTQSKTPAAKSIRLKLAQGKSWQGYYFKSSPLECDRQVAETNRTQPQSVATAHPPTASGCSGT
ncbi:MAG: hypothetical protein ACRC8Y_21605 [Chroococcales cyanobacterium]